MSDPQTRLILMDVSDREVAAEVLELQRQSYGVEARLISSNEIPPLHESLDQLRGCGETFLGLLAEGRLVGFVSWKLETTTVDLHRLVVSPARFRRGYGSALVRAALEANPDAERAVVQTGAANTPAKALYIREGFTFTDEIEPSPGLRIARFSKTFWGVTADAAPRSVPARDALSHEEAGDSSDDQENADHGRGDHDNSRTVAAELTFDAFNRAGRRFRRNRVADQRQLEQKKHDERHRDDGEHDRGAAEVLPGDRRERCEVRSSGEAEQQADDEGASSGALAQPPLPTRRLLRPVRVLVLPPLARSRHPTRPHNDRDHQRQQAENDVDGRADRVLGGAERSRAPEPIHDHEPDGDARGVRTEEVTEEKPLGMRQEQHHRRSREQGRIERSREREQEDVSQRTAVLTLVSMSVI